MTKKQIIIAVVVIVIIGLILIYKRAKRRNAEGKAFANWVQTGSTTGKIPEELQKSIGGFDEGEVVTVQGVRYIVKNGTWEQVI